MLFLGRQFQWYPDPSQSSRCDIYSRFARSVGQDQRLQEAHGLGSFPWVSSYGSDFSFDYHVSFTPEQIAEGKAYYNYEARPIDVSDEVGISIFYKNERGEAFHTYSCYSRGVDMLNGAYHYLDLVPKGRDEDGLKFSMEWVRRHDQY
jgi:predicted dithiol-disulfide oxidoreductase (DUF899 family)